MRTLLFLVAGLLLAAAFLLLGKLFAGQFANAGRVAAWLFVAVWFVVAAANMWLGVSKAGYSFGEELPIFLLVFLAPAAAALAVHMFVLR